MSIIDRIKRVASSNYPNAPKECEKFIDTLDDAWGYYEEVARCEGALRELGSFASFLAQAERELAAAEKDPNSSALTRLIEKTEKEVKYVSKEIADYKGKKAKWSRLGDTAYNELKRLK